MSGKGLEGETIPMYEESMRFLVPVEAGVNVC